MKESEVNKTEIILMTSQKLVVGISSSFFHEVLKFWVLLIYELSRTRSAFVKLNSSLFPVPEHPEQVSVRCSVYRWP